MGKIYAAKCFEPLTRAKATTDTLLTPGTTLHAEPVGKVLALGKVWTGEQQPLDDNDCDVIADSILEGLGSLSAAQRARIVEKIAKSGTSGWRVGGMGQATPDSYSHLDAGLQRSMQSIAAINDVNRRFYDGQTIEARSGSGMGGKISAINEANRRFYGR